MIEPDYSVELSELITLEPLGDGVFRGGRNQRNDNDRVYGGQLMAQAIAAALQTVAADRLPTVLQLAFMAGARTERPVDYKVVTLQEGKRFSSRYVIGSQAGTTVISANISFQAPVDELRHQPPMPEDSGAPEAGHLIPDTGPEIHAALDRAGYLGLQYHPLIDCRFVDPAADLTPASPGGKFRFWLRMSRTLPAEPRLQACALAYLSDWWVNYAGIAPHLGAMDDSTFYVASLNHSLWFHAPCRADDWLYFEVESPWANAARGLVLGRLYRQDGVLVASVAQEALQTVIPRPDA